MHSLGVGCTIESGVVVEITDATETGIALDSITGERFSIRVNGRQVSLPPVEEVVRSLQGKDHSLIDVAITTDLPFGCGFGVSGACCLATALTLNEFLGLGLDRQQVGMIAHSAEVKNLTGLGDVCGQYHGGCTLRTEPFFPLKATRLKVMSESIYVRTFGPLATRDVLSNESRCNLIDNAGERALERLTVLVADVTKSVNLRELIFVARQFAEDSFLINHSGVREALSEVDRAGGAASMIMLGNGVFADIPFSGAMEMKIGSVAGHVIVE
jgi:pantoate kinase